MPALSIVKEVTCVISGVLVIFNIDNPLTKLCPAKTTITVTSGTTKTSTSSSFSTSKSSSHSPSSSATSTIFVGSSTSVVLPGSSQTLTVPTTSSSVPITTSASTPSPSSSSIVVPTTSSSSVVVPTTSSSSVIVPTTSSSSIVVPTTTSSSIFVPTTTSSSIVDSTTSSTSSDIPPTSSSSVVLTSSSSTTASTSAATPTGYDAFNCPAGLPYSCQNTTAIADTCCFESPGGLILQTQFWDTNPATGPNNSWTIHGLWPDNCDGTYQQYCDPAREYTNITQILQSFGRQDLLDYANTYWTSNSGTAETFWEHEFGKHGTCMSTFDPPCYPNYTAGAEVVDFFARTESLFQSLPSYDWLAAAGIVPSTTVQYTPQQFLDALSPHHGGMNPYLGCSGGQIDELWYYYYVQGSIQEGNFEPTQFGSSSCTTSFWYYPKDYVPPTTSTSTPATTAPTATPTGSCTATATPFAGKGYLYVYNSAGTQQGFVISAGKWYNTAGTPATITSSSTTGQGPFTLTTSKGLCAIQADSSLFCDASVTTGAQFYSDGSSLRYNSSDVFSAASTPSGQTQGTIFAGDSMAVDIGIQWVPKC